MPQLSLSFFILFKFKNKTYLCPPILKPLDSPIVEESSTPSSNDKDISVEKHEVDVKREVRTEPSSTASVAQECDQTDTGDIIDGLFLDNDISGKTRGYTTAVKLDARKMSHYDMATTDIETSSDPLLIHSSPPQICHWRKNNTTAIGILSCSTTPVVDDHAQDAYIAGVREGIKAGLDDVDSNSVDVTENMATDIVDISDANATEDRTLDSQELLMEDQDSDNVCK